jgi:hypothetical protein
MGKVEKADDSIMPLLNSTLLLECAADPITGD